MNAKRYIQRAACLLIGGAVAHAGPILVTNSSFEDYASVGATSGSWTINTGSPPLPPQISNAVTPNHYAQEFWSTPANFGTGWQYTGAAGSSPNGQYGLQHPADNYYQRASDGTANGKQLTGNFLGEFLGFMNVRLGLSPTGSVQSGILGPLSAAGGGYTLQVAVGARSTVGTGGSSNWNDVAYEISLVADPTASAFGSTGGTILGTPAGLTFVPSTTVFGSNTTTLTYQLALDANDPMVGHDFAIRIGATNTGMKNGVPNPGSPQNFSQANFDNVKLFDDPTVPEPASLALLAMGAGLIIFRNRKRKDVSPSGVFAPAGSGSAEC